MNRSILVHGDQEFFCHLLGTFLRENGFSVVKESIDIWTTVDIIRKNPPDAVFIDARRSKGNGIEDAMILKGEFSNQKVVLLSASSEPNDVLTALDKGIDGYFLKSSISQEIIEDLEAVISKGEVRVSRELIGIIVQNMRLHKKEDCCVDQEGNPVDLTPRECEILVLLSVGKTNKEIAEKLLISKNTVKNHIVSILNKLNVHTRSSAVYRWKNLKHIDKEINLKN
ncbi:LuxR C-terminal-related transcriptional regulator [Desulfitobacterium sp. AusDCA]|uniref:LuxR C-terminal-related transcriptional regulator n=1 Tax=Desulfitobacterium sp. AusDCA TaxID=3240383 RepID=UPI003DA7069A